MVPKEEIISDLKQRQRLDDKKEKEEKKDTQERLRLSRAQIQIDDSLNGVIREISMEKNDPKSKFASEECIEEENQTSLKNLFYRSYSYEFKLDFITFYKKRGLSMACLVKNVNLDTASVWIKNF